eukprot:Hpha_TRINITY_DN16859_c1_g2::TRINITY_DN16859_c1_g2_i1::g.152505::m.152505
MNPSMRVHTSVPRTLRPSAVILEVPRDPPCTPQQMEGLGSTPPPTSRLASPSPARSRLAERPRSVDRKPGMAEVIKQIKTAPPEEQAAMVEGMSQLLVQLSGQAVRAAKDRERALGNILTKGSMLPSKARPVEYYATLGRERQSSAVQTAREAARLLSGGAGRSQNREGDLHWGLRYAVLAAGKLLGAAEDRLGAAVAAVEQSGMEERGAAEAVVQAAEGETGELRSALNRLERRMVSDLLPSDAPPAPPCPVTILDECTISRGTAAASVRKVRASARFSRVSALATSAKRFSRVSQGSRRQSIGATWEESDDEGSVDGCAHRSHTGNSDGFGSVRRRRGSVFNVSGLGASSPPRSASRWGMGKRKSTAHRRQPSKRFSRAFPASQDQVPIGFRLNMKLKMRMGRLLRKARANIATRKMVNFMGSVDAARRRELYDRWFFMLRVGRVRRRGMLRRGIRAFISNLNDSWYEALLQRNELDVRRTRTYEHLAFRMWRRYVAMQNARRAVRRREPASRKAPPLSQGMPGHLSLACVETHALARRGDPEWSEPLKRWDDFYAKLLSAEAKALFGRAFVRMSALKTAFKYWLVWGKRQTQKHYAAKTCFVFYGNWIRRSKFRLFRQWFAERQGGKRHMRFWVRCCFQAMRRYTVACRNGRKIGRITTTKFKARILARWREQYTALLESRTLALTKIQAAGPRLRGFCFAMQRDKTRTLWWRCFSRWKLYWRWRRAVAKALSLETGVHFFRTKAKEAVNAFEEAVATGQLDRECEESEDASPSSPSFPWGADLGLLGKNVFDAVQKRLEAGARSGVQPAQVFASPGGRAVPRAEGTSAGRFRQISLHRLQQLWILGTDFLDPLYAGPLPSSALINCGSVAAVLGGISERFPSTSLAAFTLQPLVPPTSRVLGAEIDVASLPLPIRQEKIMETEGVFRRSLGELRLQQDAALMSLEARRCAEFIAQIRTSFTLAPTGQAKLDLQARLEEEAAQMLARAEAVKRRKNRKAKKQEIRSSPAPQP